MSTSFFFSRQGQFSAVLAMLRRLLYPLRQKKSFAYDSSFRNAIYTEMQLPVTVAHKKLIHTYKGTIFALSSGFGKCGIAVIRVSGVEAANVLLKLTKRKNRPEPRKTFISALWHPKTKVMLDRALVFWFAGPRSFTGEDMCEFQVHGGPAVVASVLDALACVKGLRPADPGDFTKRAFLNHKFDLTEVEGLGDLIHAETEAQRRQALFQMEGALSSLYTTWSDEMLKLVAHCEASIDFGEDQHLGSAVLDNVRKQIESIAHSIKKHLVDSRRGERLRNGVRVCIAGKPNVGKSTFLNCMTQRPAAIVSPIAGTTRDVIETALDISGFPVLLSDTAGLCESHDLIEKEGIARAYQKVKEADIIIVMLSAEMLLNTSQPVSHFVQKYMQDLNMGQYENADNVIFVINKIDLAGDFQSRCNALRNSNIFSISCATSQGLDIFLKAFSERVKILCGDTFVGNIASATQQRHCLHLAECQHFLESASQTFDVDLVIAAEYMRMALREMGKISGRVDTENILDIIFQDFCIGK